MAALPIAGAPECAPTLARIACRKALVLGHSRCVSSGIVLPYPLVVDLDGTLIHTDMLHESALKVLRDRPLSILCIPFWLAQGKAVLKQELASRAPFDPGALPYNQELLAWLSGQRADGRSLILCTASDKQIATPIAEHLGIFDEVIASDGSTNIAGPRKAQALVERFTDGGFDYVGNSSADMAVWKHSRRAIVVNASPRLADQARANGEVERTFPNEKPGLSAWRRALRAQQWLKNLLLFVSLLASHTLGDIGAWLSLTLAFVAFSLCASCVYIANDLLDLESDRLHPRKRLRPFASGVIATWKGAVAAPILLAMGLGVGALLEREFLAWLTAYFALTCAYSWLLKRMVLVDCLTLAVLYTLRIVAGAAAAGHALSFWLLAFSVFLFLSLAFVKRYAEIEVQSSNGRNDVHGRGYRTSDAPLVQTMGIVSGYAAVLVLALYLNSDAVMQLYKQPELVWGAVPIMLFWISSIWMQAHRGRMHDDPLVFAIKDRASLACGVLFAAVLYAGSVGLPW